MYAGAVFQHLVGAKLIVVLNNQDVVSHGFSVADDQSNRDGDFTINDSVIHVTTFPQEALIRKCRNNIENSLKPIIITGERGYVIAQSLAETFNLQDRIEIFEITQFLSINANEIGNFNSSNSKLSLEKITEKYNEIIDQHETDPSLKIRIK